METDSIAKPVPEEVKPPDSADLVVGVLAQTDPDTWAAVCDGLHALPGPLKIAVLQKDDPPTPAPSLSKAPENGSSVFFVPSLPNASGRSAGVLSMLSAYQAVFAAGEKLQARACCIVASRLESDPSAWACELARPLFEGEVDLAIPLYGRRRFEGLLNSSVIAPLIRSLYGKRIHNPMGPDFGVSRRLFQRILGSERSARSGGNGFHPLASLSPAALCDNMSIVEVNFGTRAYPPPDWSNTSSLVAEALGPVFLDMERNASCWQRARSSAPVRAVGDRVSFNDEAPSIDTRRLIESFELGNRELQEIWGLVLPPSSLLELRKVSRLAPDQFRIPDELWVRIVYDFALAHRLRTINREHLLKSMTPLYLGWVASYVHELQANAALVPDQRLEKLALAFEAGKNYLVSRWRWPDRFNP